MSNEEIRNLCNDVFNIWWVKWRDNVLTRDSDKWDIFIQEGNGLMKKYSYQPLAVRNVCELIGEMSERIAEG